MELHSLASDVLGVVTSYLLAEDIFRLKSTTPSFLKKISTTNAVKELEIRDTRTPLILVPKLGKWLTTLRVHVSSNRTPYNVFHAGTDWVESLPKTLNELDFEFVEALSIWLRPDASNSVHYCLKSPIFGYAPIFLCDLLPNLKHLRLNGDWLRDMQTGPQRFVLERYASGEDDDAVFLGHQAPSSPVITWTWPMRALFIKKLPRDLISLEMPFIQKEFLLPHVPPSLTRLADIWTENHAACIDPLAVLPESLFETLDDWIMDCLEIDAISADLARFRHLQVCNISSAVLKASQAGFLPRTLTNLTMKCADNDFEVSHFACFPHSITTLHIVNCPHPNFTCQKSRIMGIGTPFGSISAPLEVSSQLISTQVASDELWTFLPPYLTALTLEDIQDCWDQGLLWCASKHMMGLRTNLMHLRSLSLVYCRRLQLDTMSWVPCDHLHTLNLNYARLVHDSITTDANKIVKEPSLLCALMRTWPQDVPNNITTLELTGLVDRLYYEAKHPDTLGQLLPPRLTSLTLSLEHFNPNFLTHCPRTLTRLTDSQLGIDRSWQALDLLRLRAPPLTAQESLIPPDLRFLQTTLRPNYLEHFELPADMTELSYKTIDRAFNRPGYELLRHCLRRAFVEPFPTILPSSITSIHLPNIQIELKTLRDLPNLTSLNVQDIFHKSYSSFDHEASQIPARLKTLHVVGDVHADFLCHPVAQSLNDLSFKLGAWVEPTHLAALKSMSHLTCLSTNFEYRFTEPNFDVKDFLASIPSSVTEFRTREPVNSDNLWDFGCLSAKLTSLDLSSEYSSISCAQLRLLAPSLTRLGAHKVEVMDRKALYAGLDRDATGIDDLSFLRSLCPLAVELKYPIKWIFTENGIKEVEVLVGVLEEDELSDEEYCELDEDAVAERQAGQWSHCMGDLDDSSEEQEENDEGEEDEEDDELNKTNGEEHDSNEQDGSEIGSQGTHGAMRNRAHEDHQNEEALPKEFVPIEDLPANFCEAIAALPRSLKHLKLKKWGLNLPKHLPPALIGLQVHMRTRWNTIDLEQVPSFMQSLPRNLTTLVLLKLRELTPESAKLLPPSLTTLELPDTTLVHDSVKFLPASSLRSLAVAFVHPDMIDHLPPHLTRLFISVPLTLHVIKKMVNMRQPLHSLFAIDSEESVGLWDTLQSIPLWTSLVDQL